MRWIVSLCIAASALSPCHAGNPDLSDLDEFIESSMAEWKVPGLAIAVVQDGELILARGYGMRDVEANAPVTPDTLFAIGSISKSFTAALLGMLVDEGKLDWNEPLRTYLPDLRLHDPMTTAQITARDLLCHRSGLPRHDLVWYASGLSRQELYERLRFLEPSQDFRAVWQYQNLMFMTAGILAERIEERTWEEQIRTRLFEPLQMERSNLSVTTSAGDVDHAVPYSKIDDEVRRIPFRNIDAVGPAGSINSSVTEMSRYVQLLIDQGQLGEETLLSKANAIEMQKPQMVIPGGPMQDELIGPSSYGLGLGMQTYRGHRIIQHGGGIDGFVAMMSFLPGENCGAIILSNLSGENPVPVLVTRGLYDRLLGLEPIDWSSRIREQMDQATAAAKDPVRRENTQPSHELAEYAGEYHHPAYGTVTIAAADQGLSFEYHGLDSALTHHHYDIFQVEKQSDRVDVYGERLVQFSYNLEGVIDGLSVALEGALDPIEFARDLPAPNQEAGTDAATAKVETQPEHLDPLPIRCDLPAHWKRTPTSSAMRLVQYEVQNDEPRSGEAPLECIVYHFGEGGGGGVDANVGRWVSQIETDEDPIIVAREPVEGVKVTLVDATGTFVAETRPGSGQRRSDTNHRMLAAIIELKKGPLYVKMVGPADLMANEAVAFEQWVHSFRSDVPE